MMTTITTIVPSPPSSSSRNNNNNKPRRANSEDATGFYNAIITQQQQQQQSLENSYTLQRAASSEAQLPSISYYEGTHQTHQQFVRSHSLSSNDNDEVADYDNISSTLGGGSVNNNKTNNINNNKRALQTIESGIALSDRLLSDASSLSLSEDSSPVRPPLLRGGDRSLLKQQQPDIIQRTPSHTSQHSTISYYSVDAGKHGFLTHHNHSNSTNSFHLIKRTGSSGGGENDSTAGTIERIYRR